MRFTCFSKSWRSLIRTNPFFHGLQAQRTAPSLFLQIEVRLLVDGFFLFNNYWVDLESIQDNPLLDFESIECHSIDNPFDGYDDGDGEPPRRDNLVLGSCHGLLLHQQQHTTELAVSNPTTKKHVILPYFNPAYDAKAVFCGFGYDRVHDCYKVVFKVDQLLELMVYDLTKDSWGSFPFGAWWRPLSSEFDHFGPWNLDKQDDDYIMNSSWNKYWVKCVDGAVYWCVDDDRILQTQIITIVCFLLAEEEFHLVDPPDLDDDCIYYPNLTVLDERLCLVCRALDNRTELWSHTGVDYEDDGYRQSLWIKLCAMSDPFIVLSKDPDYCDVLLPVCFSACGNKILM